MFFLPREYGVGKPGVGLRPLAPQGVLCSQDIPSNFYLIQMVVSSFVSLPLLQFSQWLVLYILSYRTSLQLDFRQF